jgi:predicted transglutaminase-like cysteine proteinase
MTLEAINTWVNTNIHYKPDVADYWQAPAETLKLGTGDCEDLAILKQHFIVGKNIAKRKDTHLWLVKMRFKGQKHYAYHVILVVGDKVLDNRYESVISLDDPEFKKTHIMVMEVFFNETHH